MNFKSKVIKFIKIISIIFFNQCSQSGQTFDISRGWEFRIGYEAYYFSLDPVIK